VDALGFNFYRQPRFLKPDDACAIIPACPFLLRRSAFLLTLRRQACGRDGKDCGRAGVAASRDETRNMSQLESWTLIKLENGDGAVHGVLIYSVQGFLLMRKMMFFSVEPGRFLDWVLPQSAA
jgi:hypothetical protein